MAKIVPCYYAPDLDTAWSTAPGAIKTMDAFAPLQSGAYGSVGTSSLFAITGNNVIKGKLFRQVDGSVRMLVFRVTDIDEYNSTGTKTNRGTGYNASTTNWEAASWGNQIIACNYLDATQSSTGAGFTALGGSSPKARYIASNLDFVMLADVDDSGSNVYSDMVWWSGLRNPATWTPALSTQAGNVRLLDVPGPIRQIVAFRDTFVVFKDNGFWVGEYVGPPPQGYIFNWRLVSSKVGCVSPDSVVELDGKLFFLHSSGVYQFDGQTLLNVGLPVNQNLLSMVGYITGTASIGDFTVNTSEGLSLVQACGDDIEGVYWLKTSKNRTAGSIVKTSLYGYNARSGKWSLTQLSTAVGTGYWGKLVSASSADMQAFKTDTAGRFWMIWNDPSASTFRSIRYPAATTDTQATVTTGLTGSPDGALRPTKFYWRTLYPSTSPDATMAVVANGYSAERSSTQVSVGTGSVNSEFDEADLLVNARYISAVVQWTLGSTTVLAGVGWGNDGRPR